MPEVKIELDKISNRIVQLYQGKKGCSSKEKAILEIISEIGDQFTPEEVTSDWKSDPATDKQIYFLKKSHVKIPGKLTKFEASEMIKKLKL